MLQLEVKNTFGLGNRSAVKNPNVDEHNKTNL